jgi:hypothetical protein
MELWRSLRFHYCHLRPFHDFHFHSFFINSQENEGTVHKWVIMEERNDRELEPRRVLNSGEELTTASTV